MMLDTPAPLGRSAGSDRASRTDAGRPPGILQLGPRDFSVLVWVRDEGDTPIYRVVKDRIKAASTAGVLARKPLVKET
jgi:hypothetical protein